MFIDICNLLALSAFYAVYPDVHILAVLATYMLAFSLNTWDAPELQPSSVIANGLFRHENEQVQTIRAPSGLPIDVPLPLPLEVSEPCKRNGSVRKFPPHLTRGRRPKGPRPYTGPRMPTRSLAYLDPNHD
ncbi:hypothetical protein PM082_007157 [Marasmius tenuissimus]|nr:hypothetical protein PM082_007157 [Marasmius tenuissimus]